MKKKTIAILGISTLCIFGLGAGVQAAYTESCGSRMHHPKEQTSTWNITQKQERRNRSIRTITDTATSEVPVQVTENPCVYGHENCDGNHNCVDGYSNCYGNHTTGDHHTETREHHRGNAHRRGHHQ